MIVRDCDGEVCVVDSLDVVRLHAELNRQAAERGRYWAEKLNRSRTVAGHMKTYRAMMRERDRIKFVYRAAFIDEFDRLFDKSR